MAVLLLELTLLQAWLFTAVQSEDSKSAVKLAFNPTKAQRDELYRTRVNPTATFPGQGTVLFGDKTGLTVTSGL